MAFRSFKDFLNSTSVVLLDGATGTELQRRGIRTALPLWSAEAILRAPAVIHEIHVDYINAGANIITANTFRTNPRTLEKAGKRNESEAWTAKAVTLALQSRDAHPSKTHPVFVAGSMTTVEDCYRPEQTPPNEELEQEHTQFAKYLKNAGVDLILVETMNTIREAVIALKAAREAGVPTMVSFIVTSYGNLLGGELLSDAVKAVELLGPYAILVNCATCEVMDQVVPMLREQTSLHIGVYAHVGVPDEVNGWNADPYATPENYLVHARQWLKGRVKIVGGCCGTTPKYIRLMDKAFRKFH